MSETPRPMTATEITERLKALLMKEIDHAKPQTEREFRLCAVRVANDFPMSDPAFHDELYNIFCDMMGLKSHTAKDGKE